MPKMKTRRSAAKRFQMTGSGKVRRARAFLRHQLSAKTRKQKRRLRQTTLVAASDERAIKRLVPYL
ncbi:MAG: 50S ribosomal protein L35 [Candidatus Binatia bacterium]